MGGARKKRSKKIEKGRELLAKSMAEKSNVSDVSEPPASVSFGGVSNSTPKQDHTSRMTVLASDKHSIRKNRSTPDRSGLYENVSDCSFSENEGEREIVKVNEGAESVDGSEGESENAQTNSGGPNKRRRGDTSLDTTQTSTQSPQKKTGQLR